MRRLLEALAVSLHKELQLRRLARGQIPHRDRDTHGHGLCLRVVVLLPVALLHPLRRHRAPAVGGLDPVLRLEAEHVGYAEGTADLLLALEAVGNVAVDTAIFRLDADQGADQLVLSDRRDVQPQVFEGSVAQRREKRHAAPAVLRRHRVFCIARDGAALRHCLVQFSLAAAVDREAHSQRARHKERGEDRRKQQGARDTPDPDAAVLICVFMDSVHRDLLDPGRVKRTLQPVDDYLIAIIKELGNTFSQ